MTRRKTMTKNKMMLTKKKRKKAKKRKERFRLILIRNQKVKRKMISTIERLHPRKKKMMNPRIKNSALIQKQKLLLKKTLM